MRFIGLLLLALLLGGCEPGRLPAPLELRVAVSANFAPTLKTLVAGWNKDREEKLKVQTMVGSSGLLAAQILSGAPYDLFFAADAERPQKLVDAEATVGNAKTYAMGRLMLWAPNHEYKSARKRLQEGDYERLAIANPELAPYGAAARSVLRKLGLWDGVRGRLVRGENVGQAFHYVVTGRVDMGFVARPHVLAQSRSAEPEAIWLVPASMHPPLEQQAVILKGKQPTLAEEFLDFCLSKAGREIIQQAGYDLPED